MSALAVSESLFATLFEASLRATGVLILALGLRWLVRRAGGARLLDLLWMVVLVRLLIPAMPAAPWSGFNLLAGSPRWSPAPTAVAPAPFPVTASLSPSPPLEPSTVPAASALPLRRGPATLAAATRGGPAPALLLLWAAGTLALLVAWARGARATQRLLRAARAIDDPSARETLDLVLRRLQLRAQVDLRESPDVTSPALAGWWRPVILLPVGLLPSLAPEARVHVLLHELGHLRRRDLWVQGLFKLALALHWWNPLVWLANRLARADREVACDDWVLRRLARFDREGGADDPCAYGETLLSLSLASATRGHLFPTAMAEDGQRLRDRVRRIAGWRRVAGWQAALGLALGGGFAVAVLADEYPGPLRPLAFQPLLDVPDGQRMRVDGLWTDGSFDQLRRVRVRGRYKLTGCDQAVLVAEPLGSPNPEPTADRVKLVPCGTGSFELDFTTRNHAPGGVVVSLVNARGACGLAGVALTPPGRPLRLPDKRVGEICWRTGERVSPGYDHLSWVGQDDALLVNLPARPPGVSPRSDFRANERTAILFENHSPRVVFLHWVDFRGRPRLWGFLSPGETFRAWTAKDHNWLVASDQGAPLSWFRAGLHPGRAVIR